MRAVAYMARCFSIGATRRASWFPGSNGAKLGAFVMPELPEVETTARGVAPHVTGKRLSSIDVRQPALRWPVTLPNAACTATVRRVYRRAKYVLFETDLGHFIVHLGMSGSLRWLPSPVAVPGKHDHIDFVFAESADGGGVLRYNDPRRFGSLHWHEGPLAEHFLLARLGVEPLSDAFSGAYLKGHTRGRKTPIKSLIMDSHIVVGVGNIYANEALFRAGIRPTHRAARMTLAACDALAAEIKTVLGWAINRGGTTLRDFVGGDGKPGYFQQELLVYGREGEPCRRCASPLQSVRISNRATVYCRNCQPASGFSVSR